MIGTSPGGYLAARAVVFEQTNGRPIDELMGDTQIRWAIRNGLWTFGVSDLAELAAAGNEYTIAGSTDRIACPDPGAGGRERPVLRALWSRPVWTRTRCMTTTWRE